MIIVDILLGVVFIASVAVFWYRVSLRGQELAAASNTLVETRLRQDFARIRALGSEVLTFYRNEHVREATKYFGGKLLYRLHIFLLRLDNKIVSWLKSVRGNGNGINGSASNGNGPKYSWQDVNPALARKGDVKKTEDIRGSNHTLPL